MIAMNIYKKATARVVILIAGACLISACMSEALERQAEQIRQQNEEIARQRKEIDALIANKQLQASQQQDCNRAFLEYFDKAQGSTNRDEVIALYRDGLKLCPDDDVAHYEFGRALAAAGRRTEAEEEFATALKINPNFTAARRQLEELRQSR